MLPSLFILATAAMPPVAGTVAATRAHWAGDVIVTDTDVRVDSGEVVRVTQLGGVVDGVGMQVSDQPALARQGDAVVMARGQVAVVAHAAVAADGAAATYGVQRTDAGVPLWRDDGCIAVALDATTISAAAEPPLVAAFGAWESATAECGGIAFHVVRAAASNASATVHVRSDRWCAPATDATSEVCFTPGAAAITRIIYIDIPGDPSDGHIVSADIELNAVEFELLLPNATAITAKPALDLQSVATHEVGHLLGLSHDCGTGLEPWPVDERGVAVPACDAPGVAAATMFYVIQPHDIAARSLESNDIAGACSITRSLACEGVVSGGCSTGGGAGSLVGVAMVFIRRRRR